MAERGLSFELVEEFEWDSALVIEDVRRNYGERRFQALGMITGRLHALVFTPRAGRVHVISLRKANRREIRQGWLRFFGQISLRDKWICLSG